MTILQKAEIGRGTSPYGGDQEKGSWTDIKIIDGEGQVPIWR